MITYFYNHVIIELLDFFSSSSSALINLDKYCSKLIHS